MKQFGGTGSGNGRFSKSSMNLREVRSFRTNIVMWNGEGEFARNDSKSGIDIPF
jgi:hypothetical protein